MNPNATLIAGLIEAALQEPYGLKVRVTQGSAERLRQAFYSWRASLPHPLYKSVSALISPDDPPGELWFVHKFPGEGDGRAAG